VAGLAGVALPGGAGADVVVVVLVLLLAHAAPTAIAASASMHTLGGGRMIRTPCKEVATRHHDGGG
jgi:hypothetical protein